ncbi:Maf family protein [Halanaerobium salsuginis]|jgi:septum formation protein|uniref:dTTP/UTP pyrophosphatase n=1 Tax=Halanaerobium salsuginis TaxID=29563 RepID=A0A1I4HP82_9FIRM|nr:Maf family protein [Halanaerobium salsuginis]SFL43975.1 septum formation protein [Halanaerobium salsuginis]
MESTNKLKLVLASASPRREEILKNLNLKFTIVPAKIDESEFTSSDPVEMVENLSVKKAEAVASLVEDALVIAADTIVVLGDEILGKPGSQPAARQMLKQLSDQEHYVMTGVSVLNSQTGEIETAHEITKVKMMELSQQEIEEYVSTGEPMDKAGAYAIQGLGALFIEEIIGSHYSVVGLPVNQLFKILRKFNYGIL